MPKKTHDLAVKVGSYVDKDGNDKNRYQNVGCIMQSENGPFMLLNKTFNPAGVPNTDDRSSIIVSIFKDKPKEEVAKSEEAPESIDWGE